MNGNLIPNAIFLTHLSATLYMTGLAWFVQHVHYPLLARVGRSQFPRYEEDHIARVTPIVGPVMGIELATAVAIIAMPPVGMPVAFAWVGLALLVVIWASTALLQVPRHRDLSRGFDPTAHRSLVATNWIRTVAWSLRAALVWTMALSISTA